MPINSASPFRHGLAVQTMFNHRENKPEDILIEPTGRKIATFAHGVTFDMAQLIAGAITKARELEDERDELHRKVNELDEEEKERAEEHEAALKERTLELKCARRAILEKVAKKHRKLTGRIAELERDQRCIANAGQQLKKDVLRTIQNMERLSLENAELAEQLHSTRESADALRVLTQRQQFKLEQQAELIRQYESPEETLVLPRGELLPITSVEQL